MLANRVRRRLVFGALTLALLAGAAELIGLSAYRIHAGEWFSYSKVHEAQRRAAQLDDGVPGGPPAVGWNRAVVVHPYLGFTFDPQSKAAIDDLPTGMINDQYGFQTWSTPVQARAPDKVIVAITGGSVAYWLSILGRATLIAELQKAPSLQGKRIELVTLAMGGYKQPQQLMALEYFLALGGQFDFVFNVDGFNEVALPAVENLDGAHDVTNPFYPRSWQVLAGQIDDRELLAGIGRLEQARQERAASARWIDHSWLRWSIAADAVWSMRDRIAREAIAGQERALEEQSARRPRTFLRNGPPPPLVPEYPLVFRELAELWKRASLQMARAAQPNGIRYFHFLQPNQYDKGSKTLTPEELARAWRERSPYRRPVELGYPYLRAGGAELLQQGVAFHDLSGLFSARGETLYVDDCCHYQELGYRLMAARIAEIVVASLAREHK